MAALHWESVRQEGSGVGRLRRTKVPGGWLLLYSMPDQPSTLTFFPDPDHEWEVDIDTTSEMPEGRGWDHR